MLHRPVSFDDFLCNFHKENVKSIWTICNFFLRGMGEGGCSVNFLHHKKQANFFFKQWKIQKIKLRSVWTRWINWDVECGWSDKSANQRRVTANLRTWSVCCPSRSKCHCSLDPRFCFSFFLPIFYIFRLVFTIDKLLQKPLNCKFVFSRIVVARKGCFYLNFTFPRPIRRNPLESLDEFKTVKS